MDNGSGFRRFGLIAIPVLTLILFAPDLLSGLNGTDTFSRVNANSGNAFSNSGAAIANSGAALANSGHAFANSGVALANSGTALSNSGSALIQDSVPAVQNTQATPVYRLTNLDDRTVFITSDFNEYNAMRQNPSFRDDGVTQFSSGETPVYRLYNRSLNKYIYSLDYEYIYNQISLYGCEFQGVAYYVDESF